MILAPLLLAAAAPQLGRDVDCASDSLPQQDMNYCAALDFQAADAALNTQWKITAAAMMQMDMDSADFFNDGRPGYYQVLLDAQRAWISYRDKHCTSEGYLFRDGSMEPFMVATCKTRLTKQRTEELRELESAE